MLEPSTTGLAKALFAVAFGSLAGYFFFRAIPPASPELLRATAGIGASLVLAYVIEAVWMAREVDVDDEYEEWLGFVTGVGIAGLLGIALALMLAEHRSAGHENFVDHIGLAWVTISLAILGGVIVSQPLLAGRFRR